ncbi:hypothetical protein [Paenibacillus sp. RC334]|uniref:hypothetical protein n=1 Tax=Paenibacillus sp. RC334 TaxID=3045840 RepID=UPI0024B98BD0|nr:hypothetical protein [Paenibacillus sp. RC334]
MRKKHLNANASTKHSLVVVYGDDGSVFHSTLQDNIRAEADAELRSRLPLLRHRQDVQFRKKKAEASGKSKEYG